MHRLFEGVTCRMSAVAPLLWVDSCEMEEQRDPRPAVIGIVFGHLPDGLDDQAGPFQGAAVGLERSVLAVEGHGQPVPFDVVAIAKRPP